MLLLLMVDLCTVIYHAVIDDVATTTSSQEIFPHPKEILKKCFLDISNLCLNMCQA